MVERDEIIEVLRNRVPQGVILTPYGNENSPRSLIRPPSVAKDDVEANADLFDLSRLSDAVVELPIFFRKTRNINKDWHSYAWKHVLERKNGIRYISAGTFIMAAYLSDFKVHWPRENGVHDVNAYFNLALRE